MTTIPASYLKAASLCMAKKGVRAYLNGVFLDFPGNRIVSTDGARMFVGRLPADCPSDWPAVIVPDALVLSVLKAMGARAVASQEVEIVLTATDDDASFGERKLQTITVRSLAGQFSAAEIDGKFPDYSRVIPAKTSGEPAGFNWQYLVDAANTLSWYSRGCASKYGSCDIAYNGSGPAVLSLAAYVDCIVVVMPMRVDVNGAWPDVMAPRPAA